MSNKTSIALKKSRSTLGAIGHTFWCSALMALPLTGLVLFFETTQPATVSSVGTAAVHVASANADENAFASGHDLVTRFHGISAQSRSEFKPSEKISTASDAESVLSNAPFASLKAGFYTEFLSRDHHRIALLIVGREPIIDRSIPDNSRLMNLADASTSNTFSFVWGQWIYKVNLEDRGFERKVVVQKVL